MSSYFNERKLDEDKTKKLIVACADANREEVDRLLETLPNIPAIINDKNNLGETALHVAATGGDHYIMQRLLENGADTNILDKHGNTPLLRAAQMGNLPACQVIVSVDPDSLLKTGSNGQTPLHAACLISNMILVSQFVELDFEAKTIHMKDAEGNSPFHSAASPPCDPKVLNFLLEHGANINDQNEKGETALLIAARATSNPGIQFLLEKGAGVLASSTGMTALHESAFRKNEQGLQMLLAVPGIPIDLPNNDGETPLALACAGGSKNCVNMLISAGADINKDCIHQAAKYDRQEIVRVLLTKKVSINATNRKGETALIIAAEANNMELCRSLLELQADPTIKYTNLEYGRKPLSAAQIAKLKGHKELAKYLTKAEKEGCFIA
eukprot:TRINITY_DN159_c0_g2_i1.p1 TRINITY_DN159_c0_g2~~TRINITY_DN159_c0_g2_i1.p1  ORF type:complete len:422 (-),score=172.26 TRINITY_DN159_c0_g2_i1:12-1163(-)